MAVRFLRNTKDVYLGVRVLGSGEMIKSMFILLIPLAYIGLYIGLIILVNCGLFDTKYYQQQFRRVHYIREVTKGELWHTISCESELVEYKKKWWQFYKIEPLPDKWFFDSEETKRMWEKIEND